MKYEDLLEKLDDHNLTLNTACVEYRNRFESSIRGWLVKQHADRNGALSEYQSAFFNAFCKMLSLEKENRELKEKINNGKV